MADNEARLEAALSKYKDTNDRDDTVYFLRMMFKYLPSDGQTRLTDDVSGCAGDEYVRQLVDSLKTGLLRPLFAFGRTPASVIKSPRLNIDDSIENLRSFSVDSTTRAQQSTLKRNCLRRDGGRCVITKFYDMSWDRPAEGIRRTYTNGCHILPFALGRYQNESQRGRMSTVWVNIFRYFPDIRPQMEIGDINREDNMITLMAAFHDDFGHFRFILEATSTVHRYKIKSFPGSDEAIWVLCPNDTVTFESSDPRYPFPNPAFLQLHVAIGNILHATGQGEAIEKLLLDYEDSLSHLAQDGSTDLSSLLSVSRLSLLSAGWNPIMGLNHG
jgi:hypothetical protein